MMLRTTLPAALHVHRRYSRLAIALLLVPVLLLPVVASAQEIPETLAYQGYLIDAEGNPVDGTVNLNFRLYDAATGGTALWAENQLGVPVTGGVFSVHLGRETSFEAMSFGRPLWLGVRVNGGSEMTPRVALEAAPYALSVRGLSVTPVDDEDYGIVPHMVAGYAGNRVEGTEVVGATIGGGGGEGRENVVAEDFGTIAGGFGNRAAGDGATVGGGLNNEALGCYDTVAGGEGNRADAENVGAAFKSTGRSCNATVGGGRDNVAVGDGSTIAGGVRNTTGRSSATVGGGSENKASGSRSTVPGGSRNQARGEHSLAAGYNARAAHDGAFVWSDVSGTFSDSLVTTAENQFLIRAAGGVGIGTNAPEGALHVVSAEGDADLILGGTDDSLFGDDGTIASDPNLPSSDLLLLANDAVGVVLDVDGSGDASGFYVFDEGLDALFQVDRDGAAAANRLALREDLGAGLPPDEGGVYRDNVVYAWANVNADGTVLSSFGCSVTRTGTGTYRITYERVLSAGAAPIVSPLSVNDPVIAAISSSGPSEASVKIHGFFNGGFQTQDRPFFVQVVGRP